MNALRHWFGSSIAGKLNAALTVIISIVFLVVGSLLTYWLGDSLERRAVKELQLTNQQVVRLLTNPRFSGGSCFLESCQTIGSAG